MLLFLYGEDDFRLKEKLKSIIKKYTHLNQTESNLLIFDVEDNPDPGSIKSGIETIPFLVEKKLIVLKNFLTKGGKKWQKELEDYLSKLSEVIILVIYEESNLSKNALFNKIKNKADKIWYFNLLKFYELENWIKKEIEKKGGKINQKAISLLISYSGSNLAQINQEIEKLVLYKKKDLITPEDVNLLVKAKLDNNIFNLIDALGRKDYQKAMQKLEELIKSGEPEIYILSMIIYQFRNLLLIKDLLEKGIKNISQKTKLHPFVLQKTLIQANNFSLNQLKQIYQYLINTDLIIKTGKIEPTLALNLLITKILS